MTMSAFPGSVFERLSTRSGKGGSRVQNEVVGLETGRPGLLFMRDSSAVRVELSS